eukprot:2045731-Alexandrium_andersonii.AAC.1
MLLAGVVFAVVVGGARFQGQVFWAGPEIQEDSPPPEVPISHRHCPPFSTDVDGPSPPPTASHPLDCSRDRP